MKINSNLQDKDFSFICFPDTNNINFLRDTIWNKIKRFISSHTTKWTHIKLNRSLLKEENK